MLKFPDFSEIPVSTKTIVVKTNLIFDTIKLFENLPITEYSLIPKKRGRKKKVLITDPNQNIQDGSIITLEIRNLIRGVLLKKKKKKVKKIKYFRNALTVVMIADGKKINFKISSNGKFQITGCKTDKQAEDCVKYVWNYIKDDKTIYKFENEDHLFMRAMFVPAMRNMDFSLGCLLDRDKLNNFFNIETEYRSLLETSIGYTGVNIKFPIMINLKDIQIKVMILRKKWSKPKYVPFIDYLNTLAPKEKEKKLLKKRSTSFLVFHSGKVICSSMCEATAEKDYYSFIDIVKTNYELFKEKLDE